MHNLRIFCIFIFMLNYCVVHAEPKAAGSFYRKHGFDFITQLITSDGVGSMHFKENEIKSAKLELLVAHSRNEALKKINVLLEHSGTNKKIYTELLIRKASLLSEIANSAEFFRQSPTKPKDLLSPQDYLSQCIQIYKSIEENYSNHQAPLILFKMAYHLSELKRLSEAEHYYNKLIQLYPKSTLTPDALFALADLYFNERKFNQSISKLNELIQSQDKRLLNFALYKKAWCLFNLKKLDLALSNLESVILNSDHQSSTESSRIELQKEALQDLVLFYSENDADHAAEDAYRYFTKFDTKGDLIFQLALLYKEQGKFEKSTLVSEKLITQLPDDIRTLPLYKILAENAEKNGRRNIAINKIQNLAKLVTSHLKEMPIDNASSELKITDPYLKMLIDVSLDTFQSFARYYYREWQKSQTVQSASDALSIYDLSLSAAIEPWRGHPLAEVFKLRSERGNLLYELKKYQAAAQDFFWLSNYWLEKKVEMIQSEIASLENFISLDSRQNHPTEQKQLLAAYNNYLNTMSEAHVFSDNTLIKSSLNKTCIADKNFSKILLSSSKLSQQLGDLAEGTRRQALYIQYFQNEDEAKNTTLLFIQNMQLLAEQHPSEWQTLIDVLSTISKYDSYQSNRSTFQKTIEFSKLKQIEQIESHQNWELASSELSNFLTKFQNSSFESQVLLKAAESNLKINKTDKAIELLEKAMHTNAHDTQVSAMLKLAPLYQSIYEWDKLTEVYLKLLQTLNSDDDKKDKTIRLTIQQNLNKIKQAHHLVLSKYENLNETKNYEQWLQKLADLEKEKSDYFNQGFKLEKTLLSHQQLNKKISTLSKHVPESLQKTAFTWEVLIKAELLLHLSKQMTSNQSELQSAAVKLFQQLLEQNQVESLIYFSDRFLKLAQELNLKTNISNNPTHDVLQKYEKPQLESRLKSLNKNAYLKIEENLKAKRYGYAHLVAQSLSSEEQAEALFVVELQTMLEQVPITGPLSIRKWIVWLSAQDSKICESCRQDALKIGSYSIQNTAHILTTSNEVVKNRGN